MFLNFFVNSGVAGPNTARNMEISQCSFVLCTIHVDRPWDWSFLFLKVLLNVLRVYNFGIFSEVGEARDLETEEAEENEEEEDEKGKKKVFILFSRVSFVCPFHCWGTQLRHSLVSFRLAIRIYKITF
jgi:hypothetical protein